LGHLKNQVTWIMDSGLLESKDLELLKAFELHQSYFFHIKSYLFHT
jgi:hypothetical protein